MTWPNTFKDQSDSLLVIYLFILYIGNMVLNGGCGCVVIPNIAKNQWSIAAYAA